MHVQSDLEEVKSLLAEYTDHFFWEGVCDGEVGDEMDECWRAAESSHAEFKARVRRAATLSEVAALLLEFGEMMDDHLGEITDGYYGDFSKPAWDNLVAHAQTPRDLAQGLLAIEDALGERSERWQCFADDVVDVRCDRGRWIQRARSIR